MRRLPVLRGLEGRSVRGPLADVIAIDSPLGVESVWARLDLTFRT